MDVENLCKICGKNLSSKHHLDRHMKIHMREKGLSEGFYHCDKCEKKYSDLGALNHHIESAHDKLDYKCSDCPMTFRTKYDWTTHKNITHSTDERFTCKHCGKRFGQMKCKAIHEKVHKDPQFQCKFCAKLFKSEQNLEAHERFHVGEKPFVCEVCGNGYTGKSGLRQHKEYMHTEEKRQHMRDTMKAWRLKQKKGS